MHSLHKRIPLLILCLCLTACESVYFSAMEKVGIHKRDILVDRVGNARDSQVEAKETFKSALERFQSVLSVEDSDLQEKYDIINSEYLEAEKSSIKVSERIDEIKEVAEALFDEWYDELDLYTNKSLKNQSKQQLNDTKTKYKQLMRSMRRAESKIEPVLSALRDQTLFLKHNLNAQAINTMKGELANIQGNVSRLVKDMEKSIAESEAFIAQLEKS
ncbi:DUF2959 domain-containing protein [Pseudomonas sp. HK3]